MTQLTLIKKINAVLSDSTELMCNVAHLQMAFRLINVVHSVIAAE